MSKNNPKIDVKKLEEIKTVGYMEGYSDGRNGIIDELIQFGLLIKNWKIKYNSKTKFGYPIK